MFPLRDENPTEILPVVTLSLIAATCAAWWYLQGAGLSLPVLEGSVCVYGAIPAELTGRMGDAGPSPCTLGGLTWQAVPASIFMHGGWMHLIGNMWFLWVFGNNIEDSMGHARFLAFYLLAGVLAAFAQVAVDPGSQLPMVGASGAISAIMGAYLVLYPRARVDTLFFFVFFVRLVPLPAWVMLGYWIVLQLASSALAPAGEGGVAYMAHIGGFVAGLVLIFPFRDRTRVAQHRAGRGRAVAGRWR